MKSKKIFLILIAFLFVLVLVFSGIGLFTVKKVQVDYTVSDDFDVFEIESLLKKYDGKNILFLKENDVKDALKGQHYAEVVSVEKKLPNILSVKIKERREIYYLKYQDKVYILNENGFVLNSIAETAFSGNLSRDQIMLNCQGIMLKDIKVGSVIKSDKENILSSVFDIAKSVNLTDCIKEIKVSPFEELYDRFDITFSTYSGVEIIIQDFLEMGKEKAIKAFDVYDTKLNDYQKKFNTIESYLLYDGNIRVTYDDKYIGD